MKLLSALALFALTSIALSDEASVDWPMSVEKDGKQVFTVECEVADGVPTVTFKRPDGKLAGSMTNHAKRESCQGEFALRALADIQKLAAAGLLD